MTGQKLKIAIGVLILLATTVWLGMSSYDDGKAYYKTADEYLEMEPAQQARRIRLMGNVVAGSINQTREELAFTVELNGATVPVVYRGTEPIPDTFKDGAEVLVEGARSSAGVFVGQRIQAKCASKYETGPPGAEAKAETAGNTAG